MPPLIAICMIPLALVFLIWLIKPLRIMTALATVMFFAQLALVGYLLSPLLLNHTGMMILVEGISIDRMGAMFALLTQVVVAAAVAHARVFFKQELTGSSEDQQQVRLFYTCSTLFLMAMTSVFFCDNLGWLWISIEATTLCSAPLVFFHKNKHALEAAWKYLIICSVGIAFALFGTILIFASSQYGASPAGTLSFHDLIHNASQLQYSLLRLGFLFCLLGYGTKAGVFPLHSWLPDAHSEAPAPASAMLSGGLLNCALFAIWRVSQIVIASGHAPLVRNTAIDGGVLTVCIASIFLIRQHGIKRLFAYSSIENVGLMLTAIGLGSGPLFFILALNHSLAKVALFLLSGNIIQAVGTKSLSDIKGLLAINPYWAALMMLATFAVTGAPPFGAFAAEWQLLMRTSDSHLWLATIIILISLALSFLAVCMHVGKMICGAPVKSILTVPAIASSLAPAILVIAALICGITTLPQFCMVTP
jgi:hydrogenase-4 component F